MTMFQNLRRSMRPYDTLKIECETCAHRVRLTPAQARASFGADATPMSIRNQSACPNCGAGQPMKVWI